MTVCIDTNALLSILSLTHPHGAMLDAYIDGAFHWAISNEILAEHHEIAEPRIGPTRWNEFVLLLERVGRLRGNLVKVSPTFRCHLITADPDDNKFADCAITAHADFVVTEDRHFLALIGSGYKPQPITPTEFIARYLPQYRVTSTP